MKRAKIMLLAIAVIATVGGVLAFKAQKFGSANVYCTSTCPAASKVLFTTGFIQAAATTTEPCGNAPFYTSAPGVACTTITTTPTVDITVYAVPNL